MSDYKVTKKDLHQANLRWMTMPNTSFNYENQYGQAVAYALAPLLRKIYPDDDEYIAAMNNEWRYFNTQNYMGQLILGAAISMEEKLKGAGAQLINDFKVGLMGPLAGVGDTLFWVLIPTIFGSIGAPMAQDGNAFGVVLWGIFTLILTIFRFRFMDIGYSLGSKLITSLNQKLNVLTDACSVLGITVVGALIPSAVGVKIPKVFEFAGGNTLVVQDMLDKIIPYSVPLLLTFICYRLLGGKKVSMTKLVLVVLVISVVASYFGILG